MFLLGKHVRLTVGLYEFCCGVVFLVLIGVSSGRVRGTRSRSNRNSFSDHENNCPSYK